LHLGTESTQFDGHMCNMKILIVFNFADRFAKGF
jgi:hypothetical protein